MTPTRFVDSGLFSGTPHHSKGLVGPDEGRGHNGTHPYPDSLLWGSSWMCRYYPSPSGVKIDQVSGVTKFGTTDHPQSHRDFLPSVLRPRLRS